MGPWGTQLYSSSVFFQNVGKSFNLQNLPLFILIGPGSNISLITVLPPPASCDTCKRRLTLQHKLILISPPFFCHLLRNYKPLAPVIWGDDWAWWAMVNYRLVAFWGVAVKWYKHILLLIALFSAELWELVLGLPSYEVTTLLNYMGPRYPHQTHANGTHISSSPSGLLGSLGAETITPACPEWRRDHRDGTQVS